MNIKQITFSPTGGTRKVADAFSSGISGEIEQIELISCNDGFRPVSFYIETI